MKKSLFLLITITTLIAKSQTSVYHPFPITNTLWEYYDVNDMSNTSYFMDGDTIILGVNYKKVYYYSTYAGALRENNKIVYFVPDASSTEYLLYNFNLHLGDTLIQPYGGIICTNDTAIIDQEDSVLTSDGYHRTLSFRLGSDWIEGIGSTIYLLAPCQNLCLTGGPRITCMISDSGFTYPPGATCLASVNSLYQLSSEIIVVPNPFNSSAQVYLSTEFENANVQIYNIMGLLIYNDIFSNKKTFELNREKLSNGIYLIKLTNSYGRQVIRKILVN